MPVQKPAPDESSTEVVFEVRDHDLFFVRASASAGCTVALERMVHRSDGRLLEYFTVGGARSEQVLATAAAASEIDDARLVRETDDEALFEFLISGPCIGATLADAGAILRDLEAVDGVGRVVADVPPHVDLGHVLETVDDRHDVDVVAKQSRDRAAPEFTACEFRESLADRLTDRQLEILRAAYASGYFNWPRDSTALECAEALDISQPTFAEHLRVGERKLLEAVLDDAVALNCDR